MEQGGCIMKKGQMNIGAFIAIMIMIAVVLIGTIYFVFIKGENDNREYSDCVKRQCAMCLFNDSECYENECNVEELGCVKSDGKPDIYMEK